MFSKTLIVLASAALIVYATAPAHAYISLNGGGLNGVKHNGYSTQGHSTQGHSTQGHSTQGTATGTMGFAIDGIVLPAAR